MEFHDTIRTYSQGYRRLRRYIQDSVYRNKTFPRLLKSHYGVVNTKRPGASREGAQYPEVQQTGKDLVADKHYSRYVFYNRGGFGVHQNILSKNSLPPTRDSQYGQKFRTSKSAPPNKTQAVAVLPKINNLVSQDRDGSTPQGRDSYYLRKDKFATSWASARAENNIVTHRRSAKRIPSKAKSDSYKVRNSHVIDDDTSDDGQWEMVELSGTTTGDVDIRTSSEVKTWDEYDTKTLEERDTIMPKDRDTKSSEANDTKTSEERDIKASSEDGVRTSEKRDRKTSNECGVKTSEKYQLLNRPEYETKCENINKKGTIKSNKSGPRVESDATTVYSKKGNRVSLHRPSNTQQRKSEFIEKVWEKANDGCHVETYIIKTRVKENPKDVYNDDIDMGLLEKNVLSSKYKPTNKNSESKTERNGLNIKSRYESFLKTMPLRTHTSQTIKVNKVRHKSPVFVRARTKHNISAEDEKTVVDGGDNTPMLNNPKYLEYLYSSNATEAQVRLRELLNKTNESLASTNSGTSNNEKQKRRMLSKRETAMYIHLTNVYANSNSQQKRQERFIEQLEQRQDELEKRLRIDQQKADVQAQEAKRRGYTQLKRVREKFDREQTRRFRTQYVTSKVLEHELETRHVYGLPENIDALRVPIPHPLPRQIESNKKENKKKRHQKNLKIYGMVTMAARLPDTMKRSKAPLMDGIDVVKIAIKDENGANVHAEKVVVKDVINEAKQLVENSPPRTPGLLEPRNGLLRPGVSTSSLSTLDPDEVNDIFEKVRQKYGLDVSSDDNSENN